MKKDNGKALINISKKTFIQVAALLLALVALSVVLTYVIPGGQFGTTENGKVDYSQYIRRDDIKGINVLKGVFSPVLVFFSSNGLSLIMLSLFLLIISSSFQVMNDVGGIEALIGTVSDKFRNRKTLLIIVVSLFFMCFGAFLGLFEEMLTMLPIMTMLCIAIGYDSFTGFLISIVACGFGFASAITNPFTVLLASEIIEVNPMHHVYYRFIVFFVMYALLIGFILLYTRKITKDPLKSLTYEHDERIKAAKNEAETGQRSNNKKRVAIVYSVFLLAALALIIICSSLSALRDYTVPVLIAYFLIFGISAGIICGNNPKFVFKSFLKGLVGAMPTLVFIALAAAVKYVFDEGAIMPTIVWQINNLTAGKNIFVVALVIYLIILLLEFFISSSTAKAILVMGILAAASVGLSKSMLVLIYTFADGYTNVIFPTSPVLLISLSMIEVDYFKWVKKSLPLFAVNVIVVLALIALGIIIGY
ncbi:MAG: hypothetical protein J5585_08575 [Clostridia bacterium]|nr:hypothetical protein [Clostridia bacterium]